MPWFELYKPKYLILTEYSENPSLKCRLKWTELMKTDVNQNARSLGTNEELFCHRQIAPIIQTFSKTSIEHLLCVRHHSRSLGYIRRINKQSSSNNSYSSVTATLLSCSQFCMWNHIVMKICLVILEIRTAIINCLYFIIEFNLPQGTF